MKERYQERPLPTDTDQVLFHGENEGAVPENGDKPHGLTFERRFTTPGHDPFDKVKWELRSASITSDKGDVLFQQDSVEIPASWSQMATNVVVSKYFRGGQGTPDREHSVKQLIGRVVDTITGWGLADGYFASVTDRDTFHAELKHLLLNQYAAFNSPVWFNVGVEGTPQCSACFINAVDDSMASILDLAKTEGLLFKYGSGTGTNLSPLRSSREKLSTGGEASGPVSFMKGFDAFAGVIKSSLRDMFPEVTGGYALAVTTTIVAAIIAQAMTRGALFSVLSLPLLLPLSLSQPLRPPLQSDTQTKKAAPCGAAVEVIAEARVTSR